MPRACPLDALPPKHRAPTLCLTAHTGNSTVLYCTREPDRRLRHGHRCPGNRAAPTPHERNAKHNLWKNNLVYHPAPRTFREEKNLHIEYCNYGGTAQCMRSQLGGGGSTMYNTVKKKTLNPHTPTPMRRFPGGNYFLQC